MRAALARWRLTTAQLWEQPWAWAAALGAALVCAVALSATLGAVEVPLAELPRALADEGHALHPALWLVRLPRIAVAALVGAGLAVAGALMQTVVRNPLADPGLLGVTAGAGAATLLALVLVPERTAALPLFAFGGGLGAVLLVLALSWSRGSSAGTLRIVLSGVAIQAVLFSVIALVTFLFADRAPAFAAFTVGSLNGVGWREARLAAPPVALGVALAWLASRPLNRLLLDDATAGGIGVDVRRARLSASCLAALLAAGAVSVAGMVGFVGLVVPNAIRIVAGPDHRRLLPLAALGGAALVVLTDLAARTLVAPLELPVGALLALVGGPYFLFILWRQLP